MASYILAIDQGTTATTALVFDEHIRVLAKASVEFPQYFPKPGWVEHDLDEIWQSVGQAVAEALQQGNIEPRAIAAIGITNQRETTCLWHRNAEATPASRAIVWQDRRTVSECVRLKARKLERNITQKTGLLLDPYFSATKLVWLLKNVPGVMNLARKGTLAFGTVESYLLYRMTGNHCTDVSNASRTMLMNLKSCEWDEDLLKLFKVPRSLLPEIRPSAVEYGKIRNCLSLVDGTPVTGLAGDQQAAMFGQACFERGSAKCTYGTGAFLLTNVGEKPVYSKHRLLSTVGWKLGDKVTYCLEGSAFIAGAAVQWLRDGLQLISSAPEIENLAATVPDSEGVVFVPALSGMGAPYWLAEATGLITGITRGTTRAHIARAALEGIALQLRELSEAMAKDYGKKIRPLKVDGGASANNMLMQYQADLLGVDVVRSKISETTALGSGLQAGLAVGLWKNTQEIKQRWEAAETFKPRMSVTERKKEVAKWERAMKAVKGLSKTGL